MAHLKSEPKFAVIPHVWEETLLLATSILFNVAIEVSARERLLTASAFLFGFDLYRRGGDAPLVRTAELRPPAPIAGNDFWTVTLHPGRRDAAVAGTRPCATTEWHASITVRSMGVKVPSPRCRAHFRVEI